MRAGNKKQSFKLLGVQDGVAAKPSMRSPNESTFDLRASRENDRTRRLSSCGDVPNEKNNIYMRIEGAKQVPETGPFRGSTIESRYDSVNSIKNTRQEFNRRNNIKADLIFNAEASIFHHDDQIQQDILMH